MRRDQLEHAIRAACQIIDQTEVIVVGSQAILGSFMEEELPEEATMSNEIDLLPIADSDDEVARLADLIEGTAGEFSRFEELHGFSIDGGPVNLGAPGRLARPADSGPECQYSPADRYAPLHRLVPRAARPQRGQTVRVPREGHQLR